MRVRDEGVLGVAFVFEAEGFALAAVFRAVGADSVLGLRRVGFLAGSSTSVSAIMVEASGSERALKAALLLVNEADAEAPFILTLVSSLLERRPPPRLVVVIPFWRLAADR